MSALICADALPVLRRLPDGLFAAAVTSPPYNGGIKSPPGKAGPGGVARAGRWSGQYDQFGDNLPAADYIRFHRAVLTEMLRLLKPDGLIWYIHRRQPRFDADGEPSLVDSVLAGFPVRQEIIWHKGVGVGFCAPGPAPSGAYYLTPSYESIWLLAADKQALVRRDIAAKGNLWAIPRERIPGHPAPFPTALATRCIEATMSQGPVLDPFSGSGTTLVADARLGREYLGIDQSEMYCDLARRRLSQMTLPAP